MTFLWNCENIGHYFCVLYYMVQLFSTLQLFAYKQPSSWWNTCELWSCWCFGQAGKTLKSVFNIYSKKKKQQIYLRIIIRFIVINSTLGNFSCGFCVTCIVQNTHIYYMRQKKKGSMILFVYKKEIIV